MRLLADAEENGRIKMRITITNKEFEILFNEFKKMIPENIRVNGNNGFRTIPNSNNITQIFSIYKLTNKQFKKIVDYCLDEEDDGIVKLAYILADFDEAVSLITDSSYEYALTEISKKADFKKDYDIIEACFYFKSVDYYSPNQTKREREILINRQNVTLKCLELFEITDRTFLKDIEYNVRDTDYKYRNYNFNCAFNEWIRELSIRSNGIIDEEYFQIEDNLEEILDDYKKQKNN